MKRLFALLLVIVLALGLMAGCGGDGDGDTDSTASTGTGAISTDDVKFVNGETESVYTIIRPLNNNDVVPISQYLFQQMKTKLGVTPRTMFDDEDGADKYEILLGDVNRTEVQQAKEHLIAKTEGRYDDFVICTIGKKIVIYAFTNENLDKAVKYFVNTYVKPEGVKGGIDYAYAAEGNFETITVGGANIGKFKFIRPHYNSSYLAELEMRETIDTVYKKTGFMLEVKHDTLTEAGDCEIIVGNCNRDGVEAVTDYDEYKITVKGNKVYINGGSAHATAMGVSEFTKLLKGDLKDASTTGSYNNAIASYDKKTNLYKTWGEDFDGNALNTDRWILGHPGSPNWKGQGIGGKPWIRSHDPNDVYVKDGLFTMTARYDDMYYYGGMIQTYGTFKYGYIEMSAVIPQGVGFWSALYCQADYKNEPSVLDPERPLMADPEFDIMECFGDSSNYAANLHSWPRNGFDEVNGWVHTSLDGKDYGNDKKYRIPDENKVLGNDFHTYGMMWNDKLVTFTCDGEDFFSYDITTKEQDVESFNHNVWVRIALSVGNADNPFGAILTENPDEWQFTNKFMVDWINIYQYDDGKCRMDLK